jgi:hypothetical protein
MDQRLTQPLTEMSSRYFPEGKGRPARKPTVHFCERVTITTFGILGSTTHHRSHASRRRRRKGNLVPESITGPPCSSGIYGDLALQVGKVLNQRQQNVVMSPAGLGP